jgi:hypothetical protein
MPNSAEKLRAQIAQNAIEISRLHSRIHETYKRRDESEQALREWQNACDEFHARYGQLCLPGGWDERFFERILSGDGTAVELALCFLEVRPYFFRSGYLWKNILQKCKRAPMADEQAERFRTLLASYNKWKQERRLSSQRGSAVKHDLWPLLCQIYEFFPVRLPDAKFDGVETACDLYGVLCRALKIAPLTDPERRRGVIRKWRRPAFTRDRNTWLRNYREWREFAWTAEDVWATLASLITEAYGQYDSSTVIPGTILRKSDGK